MDECCVASVKEPVQVLSLATPSSSQQASSDCQFFSDGASLDEYLCSSAGQSYSCRLMYVFSSATVWNELSVQHEFPMSSPSLFLSARLVICTRSTKKQCVIQKSQIEFEPKCQNENRVVASEAYQSSKEAQFGKFRNALMFLRCRARDLSTWSRQNLALAGD